MPESPSRLEFESVFRLLQMADYIIPFTIRAVSELGVADHLVDGPKPVGELAAATATDAPSLHRALRALASMGIFAECAPGLFGLTPMAELLRSDHPFSLRNACILPAADLRAWAQCTYSLRTGEPAFDLANGESYWDYMMARPDESARFDHSMEAWTRLELLSVLPAYDWGRLGRVVDVGGGNGAFLAGLLTHFPQMRGVLFDLAHVIASAPAVMKAAAVIDRCEILAGSFFESLPADGDAYVFKRIIYSWDDDQVSRILKLARAAMARDGRILILEPVRRGGDAVDVGKVLDLQMLVLGGHRVRSRKELRELLASAQLKLTRVIPTTMTAIVEARPV
jgi:SAM-dependent methyltransferase